MFLGFFINQETLGRSLPGISLFSHRFFLFVLTISIKNVCVETTCGKNFDLVFLIAFIPCVSLSFVPKALKEQKN